MINNYNDYYNSMNNQNIITQKNSNNIEEPYIGFIRGNMFKNLYSEYKNYKSRELNPKNNKEYLQLLLQMYGFASHDLGLYLDINPEDIEIINKRREYVDMYKQVQAEYETNFGPIQNKSSMLYNAPWAWDTKKWPWEGNV